MLSSTPRYGETRTRNHARAELDVWNEVPLVPQTTGMSCWAAAAAMLVGWRDRVPVDPQEVATGAGHWSAYSDGLDPEDVDQLATAWGLVVVPPARWSVERMRTLLAEHGPLWVGEASPGLHSLVITGLFGDGTPNGTFVRINDPWPIGRGERYVLPFSELLDNLEAATAAVGAHAQVLHAGGRGRGASRSYQYREHLSTSITTPDKPGKGEHTMDHFGRTYGRARAFSDQNIAASDVYLESATLATDPLASHGGSGENLFLRWNAIPESVEAVDVVVHLHGYSSRAANREMLAGKVGISGVDLSARGRPTLVIVPRGRKITPAEITAAQERGRTANPARYTFPGLLAGDGQGLEDLVAHAVAWFASNSLGRSDGTLMVDRLILTGHSGGGAPLNALLRHHATRQVCNPHEVFVFDGLYAREATKANAVSGLLSWGLARASGHASTPGALRVLYRSGTRLASEFLAEQLSVPADAASHFRIESATVGHNEIPNHYGPTLLGDAAATFPGTTAAGQGRYGTPVALFNRYRANPPRRALARSFGRNAPPFPTQEEIDWIVAERPHTTTAQGLRRFPRGLALQPSWANDAVSVDYRHLQAWPGVNQSFALTGDVLAELVQANRFSVPGEGVVLFGLRGCMIMTGDDGAFHASVTLDQDIPDHKTTHCVLGVWNRDTNQVAVFTGSTVPHERYMRNQVNNPEREANMMLTGAYSYRVGIHKSEYHGLLIETGTKVVLRSRDDLVYDTDDDFDKSAPGDNLHPSFSLGDSSYSSAGCMTIRGSATKYDGGDVHANPTDESPGWATFRERAGLSANTSDPGDDGRRFSFVMLTGREAYITATEGSAMNLQRLRFGSQGTDVDALQTFLAAQTDAVGNPYYAGDVDSDMGPGTTEAWVRYQKAHDAAHADGVVTPDDATAMGFSLEDAGAAQAQGYGRPRRRPRAPRRRPPPHRFGRGLSRAFVDENSSQAEQSQAVKENIARSLQAAEGTRFNQVHYDSQRVNFGIGSWTGSRIGDLLETYATFAAEIGQTATMHGYFGGAAAFNALRDRFRADGGATAISAAEETALENLGGDANLRDAQIRHLADDITTDLVAIDNDGIYPFYDAGMGAFSEWAVHVLVHARHQAGGGGLRTVINDTIAHFGGDSTMGQGMINGTITETDVLQQIAERVAQRAFNGTRSRRIAAGDSVAEAERRAENIRQGVLNRYTRLRNDWSGSSLAYYVYPQ